MQDGNKNKIYKKKSKGAKVVTAREYDKSKRRAVPHGTNTIQKGSSRRQPVTKVKGNKKILTDGGYMYV